MPVDTFAQVRFEEGEGLSYVDLNNITRFIEARVLDQLLRELVGYNGESVSAPKDPIGSPAVADPQLAYVLNAGSCVLKQGTTGTRLGLTTGTVFQSIASADGNDPKFLAYSVGASDVDLTITAGHATNPRIDILQMRLEYVDGDTQSRDIEDAVTRVVSTFAVNKERRVQATFSIKNGTAGANPVYPAPDSGYCVVGAVRVPALWSTGVSTNPGATTSAIIRQLTMPLKVEEVTIMPHLFDLSAATNWSMGTLGEVICPGGAGTNMRVWIPGGTGKRLVGVGVTHDIDTSGDFTIRVGRSTPGSGWVAEGPQYASIANLLPAITGATQSRFVGIDQLQGASSLSQIGVNGAIGDPIWASGGAAGPATRRVELEDGDVLGSSWAVRAFLEIDAGTGSRITEVTFYLAG
jgi:hypothetical protein